MDYSWPLVDFLVQIPNKKEKVSSMKKSCSEWLILGNYVRYYVNYAAVKSGINHFDYFKSITENLNAE